MQSLEYIASRGHQLTTENKIIESQPGASENVANPPQWQQEPETMVSDQGQLISFGERVTFTFTHGREVGSIHFDRERGEIFYKGHNIRNMELEEWQMQVLEGLRGILAQNPKTRNFTAPYCRSLDKAVQEKSRRGSIIK